MASSRSLRLSAAIERLADLYPDSGHLLLCSIPENLLKMACDEIEQGRRLRAAAARLKAAAGGDGEAVDEALQELLRAAGEVQDG